MIELNPVRVAKITESIVETIEEMLLDGTLNPGDRLPPERELAERISVSQPEDRLPDSDSRGDD